MEFYLNQSYTYQAGPNDYRYLDLGRLPPSEQQKALAAVQNPGAPGSLVVLAGLQTKYPTAFAQVSSLSTLPAPDLNVPMGGSFPLGAGLDMILAYLNQKTFKIANELAEMGNQRVVTMSRMTMDLADKAEREAKSSAQNTFIAGLVGGSVALGAGLGSIGGSVYSGVKSKGNSKAMKESTTSQLKTQEYKDTMERNVKQLQDNVKSNRDQVLQLKSYTKEVDSPDGLSPASRQKLDDSIAEKNARLAEIDSQKDSYQRNMADADIRSKDVTLTQSKRAAAKQEFDDLKAGENDFMADMKVQRDRVQGDRDALANIKKMDADRTQIKSDMKRLEELMEKSSPTPAEAREMHDLRASITQRTENNVRQRASVEKHVDKLDEEAARMDAGAVQLEKSMQDELASRQKVHSEQDKDLSNEMTDTELLVRGVNTATTAISQSTNLFSAGPQQAAQIATAEADLLRAEAQYAETSKNLANEFGNNMNEKAKGATDFWQQYNQNNNEVVTSIAHNI